MSATGSRRNERPESESEVHRLRRQDRERDDEWIRGFLSWTLFGFLATVAENRPFLNSNLFVYEPKSHCIYLHTARTGRTPQNVDQGGLATFSAAVMGRFLPASEALEFSVEYAAVVAFGQIRPVSDEGERRDALESVMRKYAPHLRPGADYRDVTAKELARTGVHRLNIDAWSGKEKVAPPGFRGAYRLPLDGWITETSQHWRS